MWEYKDKEEIHIYFYGYFNWFLVCVVVNWDSYIPALYDEKKINEIDKYLQLIKPFKK